MKELSVSAIVAILVITLFPGCAGATRHLASDGGSFGAGTASGADFDQLVPIDARNRLHIRCLGTGSPTVILEAGFGNPGSNWSKVDVEVAKFTRVCSYDRGGLGASDPGQSPRLGSQIASELKALLKNASIAPPYVLVGQSYGGLLVRIYERAHPDEVTGLVLVDATHENQLDAEASRRFSQPLSDKLADVIAKASGIQETPGWLNERSSSSPTIRDFQSLNEIGHQPLGARPLVVIRAGRDDMDSLNSLRPQFPSYFSPVEVADLNYYLDNRLTKRDQPCPIFYAPELGSQTMCSVEDIFNAQLTQLSSRGKLVTAEQSGHNPQIEQPEIVISAIRSVISQVGRQ